MASNTDDIKNDSEWISFTSSPLNCFTFSYFRGSPNLWKPKRQILSVLNQNTSCLFSHSYETADRMKRKNLGFGVSPHLGLNPVHCVCCMPACMLSPFSRVRLLPYGLCSPPGSSVHGFSRQEYWSGLSCPLPWDLLTQGSNLHLLHQAVSLPLNHLVSSNYTVGNLKRNKTPVSWDETTPTHPRGILLILKKDAGSGSTPCRWKT